MSLAKIYNHQIYHAIIGSGTYVVAGQTFVNPTEQDYINAGFAELPTVTPPSGYRAEFFVDTRTASKLVYVGKKYTGEIHDGDRTVVEYDNYEYRDVEEEFINVKLVKDGLDGATITLDSSQNIQTIGLKNSNDSSVQKIWVGTLAQYTAQNKAATDDLCIITDDDTISNTDETKQQAAVAAMSAAAAAQNYANQTEAVYDSIMQIIPEYYVAPAYGYGITYDGTLLSFTWCDPADNNVTKWKKTRLIYKLGGFPENENDGTVICDNTVRNQYKTTPFTYDMGVVSNYYFALFTQSTSGSWDTSDNAPRFTTDVLTWATIGMMSRAGTLLTYPSMAIGSKVDFQWHSQFPKCRYKLAHIDYTGTFQTVGDFMYDNNRTHNSIWIPDYLPCLEASNDAAMIQFDAPELTYAATWDTTFISGKTYYTVSGETYTALTAGTDYEVGTSVADWETAHGDTVYSKNHASRISNGNNIWKESNMRIMLSGTGSGYWSKQNEYDVRSSGSVYSTGFLTGVDAGFMTQVCPVYNKTARNTVAAVSGGGGGGYDITLDTFWLPSMNEVFNTNINNIAEGAQLAYFRDVATTASDRIQRDEGGTARDVWLRSPGASYTSSVCYVNPSGSSRGSSANGSYAFLPLVCL